MNETGTRTISGIFLMGLYIFTILFTKIYYLQMFIVASLVIYFGLNEFFRLAERENYRPFRTLGIVYSLLITTGFYLDLLYNKYSILQLVMFGRYLPFIISGFAIAVFLLFLLLVHSFTIYVFTREVPGAIYSVIITVGGVIYVTIPVGTLMLLLTQADGVYYILLASIITIMNDTGAYFGGRKFGKTSAGIKASPNKTREGYISGMIVAVIFALVFNSLWKLGGMYSDNALIETIIIGILLSLLGGVGDLAESVMKRDAGVKDSASIIPGHGGILDRLDSMFFTIPAMYFYINIREVVIRIIS